MRNKRLFKQTVMITTLSLSISACMIGCGKQGEEPVMASLSEDVTLENEVESETVTTEEETESSQESTVEETETESATQDYEVTELNKEMQATETDVTAATEDVSIDTDETNIDVTADVAEATGAKTVIIDGEVYVDLGGDDDDNYVPPIEDTGSTQNPTTYKNPETGDTTIFTPGSGDDKEYILDGSDPNIPEGHFIQ